MIKVDLRKRRLPSDIKHNALSSVDPNLEEKTIIGSASHGIWPEVWTLTSPKVLTTSSDRERASLRSERKDAFQKTVAILLEKSEADQVFSFLHSFLSELLELAATSQCLKHCAFFIVQATSFWCQDNKGILVLAVFHSLRSSLKEFSVHFCSKIHH